MVQTSGAGARPATDPSLPFEEVEAGDRQRIVIEHLLPSVEAFFSVVSCFGVLEWITRPTHRTALVFVGTLYVVTAVVCVALVRLRPRWAVHVAVGGVSAVCAAMLAYSPLVRGNGELCVLAITVLLGGFTVTFPVGLRYQLLASIMPLFGYGAVLQLGTTTAFPVWYSASALVTFLVVLAAGAHTMDQYRSRILHDGLRQAALAAENGRLRDQAWAANRAKSDLVSILSHELRTPLGAIRNFSELLTAGVFSDADEVRSAIQRIREQSNRAVDLLLTMLEFDSIESGRLHVSVEEFEVAELLDRIRDDLPVRQRGPTPPVLWQAPPESLRMRTDRGKVEAIVRNLLHNALRHTQAGSVTVAVSKEPAEDAVRFAVADTGEGIAPEALPHIFERYSRATLTGGGFGLGLFIVKRFAQVLGGAVSVESTLGVGTRFQVVIPIEAPAAVREASAPRAA